MIMFSLPLVTLAASALTPTHLRTDYLVNPIGIDDRAPRLSWIVESPKMGAKQSAYRILVASDPKFLRDGIGDLWDSGKVSSRETAHISYQGKPLASGQRAWWTVTVWDADGTENHAKPGSFFEEAMLSDSDWKANWIGMQDADVRIGKDRPSAHLRRSFDIESPVKRVRIYASAKGLYRLFLDGKQVTTGFFTPGWTDYRKRIQYQTYDVTANLKPGKHAIGLLLGDGWYCGHVGLTGGDNYGKKPMGLAQVEIQYENGRTERIVTDGSWQASHGAIRSNDTLDGETHDARKELTGWSKPDFEAKNWKSVDVQPIGEVPLVAQHSPLVEKLTEMKPKKITVPAPNTYVYDLGQNMVGWARLRVHGPEGTTVKLRFAEILNPDGTIYTANLRGAKVTDYYTLDGRGDEVFEPKFTFHGFRYVEVTGYPGVPGKGDITGIVVGSNNPQTGTFSCSNALVNQLQSNIFWGQRGNYFEAPTDCPQRDERLGWMGDAQIFARTAAFNNDIAAFMTKWTQDVVDAQSPAGGFSDVSPRIGDPNDGAPAWGDAGVIVPWTMYLCYADKPLLAERYPSMQKWIEYIDSVNPNHIWVKRSNNNFGDWLNVQDDTPREVLATAYFSISTDILAKTARVLGKSEDAAKYEALRDSIRAAFNEKFVDQAGIIKGDTQTAYVLALKFDLLPVEKRNFAAQRLVNHIVVDRKGHLSTGFLGVGHLNRTLTNIGRSDVAYQLLLNDTYPSWGYSIRQGATTIWERWDGWTTDKGFQNPGMNSFNHYSLGSVGEWMYETVAGIGLDPEKPGYEHILIHPVPGGDLKWAKASLNSLHGQISSDWKIDSSRFVLETTIPANTSATVWVPASSVEAVTVPSGATFVRMDAGSAVFTVDAGRYRFESRR